MTPEDFITKWRANTRNERAACHEHFIDLCRLLDESTPNADPDGANYAFEKGAIKATGGDGWADVWRRECFAWEYKGKHKDLEAAHRQLLLYAGALGNPPLLVVCDIERIIIRTNWTNAVSERHEILLADLADANKRALLKSVFSDPERLRPGKTRAALTAQAAAEFAELATRLRARGHAPQTVAHFVNRLVFCLFADDVDLLPKNLFNTLLASSRRKPARFADFARQLFAAMAERDGLVGFTPVSWFNGGLFDDDTALPLEVDDIALLQRAAELDWAEIDPSIFGTLFERGLDPDKRSQLGAHYTGREKIEKIIDPVVRRPLAAEWAAIRQRIEAALDGKSASRGGAKRSGTRLGASGTREADRLYRGFLDRLENFRILDPACGSGNFLYLGLMALKDIEHQTNLEAESLGLQRQLPRVGPEAVLGIEINPFAAELARVSVWIGHIQWARNHGYSPPSDPILRKLDTIECRDALLDPDANPAAWPTSDVIVGNPPFLGGKLIRRNLGDGYFEHLLSAYKTLVPGGADLVCYWFAKANEILGDSPALRVGFVATNSIRGGSNRQVLDSIVKRAVIYEAWSDEPWELEGAAVRVSLICIATKHVGPSRLDGRDVATIHADLASGTADLTQARRLPQNAHIAFNGIQKTGPFEIAGPMAREWLLEPTNANGRPNADVLRPYWNGIDVARRPRDIWIVDFGPRRTEQDAEFYMHPFAYISEHVRPERAKNSEKALRSLWWRHWRPREEMTTALASLQRCIVSPEVSKHRLFTWMPRSVGPDKNLVVIARADDTAFGILQSKFHELWALGLGTWLGVGNDPRYTPSTTFETFPFPEGLTPNLPAAAYAADPRAQKIAAAAQALVQARDRWLNPPELVDIVPEVVPGFPDRILPKNEKAAAILKTRTLTNLYNTRGTPAGAWLDNLHRTLDEAVADAYGWPHDLPDDEILARLLALNHARAGIAP